MAERVGLQVKVKGIVQGVGFRPFVYQLANRLELKGWVRNTTAGVDIQVDGSHDALQNFVESLRTQAPPLAHIDEIQTLPSSANGFTEFHIEESRSISEAFQPISPDVAICPDCLRELFDPQDRHYRYPFVNCTHCGPRFTIIRDLPYDRPNTTMAGFAMCPACAKEYCDPTNRRYHAQPVSCSQCGPRIWLEIGDEVINDQEDALRSVRRMIAAGEVVAIKGLGGFHLACDATNSDAVAKLRLRKGRADKPLALMMADPEVVRRHCLMDRSELDALQNLSRPIVLLRRRENSAISENIAPRQHTLGVMLPYTPLHFMLLEREDGIPDAWVMTSGNRSEEPIITENEEAKRALYHIAAAFLMHDRPIHSRCDDSVIRIEPETRSISPIRRSRGIAPMPVHLPWSTPPLLATGAELKNTFCVAKDEYAFLSQYIGDLQNYETLHAYEQGIRQFEHIFRVVPQALAYDLHPNYLSTRYALQRAEREGIPAIGVQHHHAHIASCMAEHSLPAGQPVIGLAFDGTGYGTDGTIWGGEVLLADYKSFRRMYHLNQVAMPGGDLAVQQPWRLALAWLRQLGIAWQADLPPVKAAGAQGLHTVARQLETRTNAPLTSSMGRLFDTVAALIGVCSHVTYEGQAAIELENLVDPHETAAYTFVIASESIDPWPVIRSVLSDWRSQVPLSKIAARFHNGLADLALDLCLLIRSRQGIEDVTLSGGVWQNMTLLTSTRQRLLAAGFRVYTHHKVPANDSGLALGQAVVAYHTYLKP
ncbi:MAG TPA: carbamoyltransferase HypF [Anaerolineales bacterium]|nr:carbamoyltransferase HypF [Anaerolineales bacterium]